MKKAPADGLEPESFAATLSRSRGQHTLRASELSQRHTDAHKYGIKHHDVSCWVVLCAAWMMARASSSVSELRSTPVDPPAAVTPPNSRRVSLRGCQPGASRGTVPILHMPCTRAPGEMQNDRSVWCVLEVSLADSGAPVLNYSGRFHRVQDGRCHVVYVGLSGE